MATRQPVGRGEKAEPAESTVAVETYGSAGPYYANLVDMESDYAGGITLRFWHTLSLPPPKKGRDLKLELPPPGLVIVLPPGAVGFLLSTALKAAHRVGLDVSAFVEPMRKTAKSGQKGEPR